MTHDYDKARGIDDDLDHEEAVKVGYSKFVQVLAETTENPDVGVVEATYRSLDKLERSGVIGTDDLKKDVENARETAETALTVAQRNGSEEANKTEGALEIARDELVRRFKNRQAGQSIALTNSDVQKMGTPEFELDWTTVDRVFGKLVERWDEFQRTVQDGEKALTINGHGISDDLARVVAVSLDRPDIADAAVGGDEE